MHLPRLCYYLSTSQSVLDQQGQSVLDQQGLALPRLANQLLETPSEEGLQRSAATWSCAVTLHSRPGLSPVGCQSPPSLGLSPPTGGS